MNTIDSHPVNLQAEVEALRLQHPETQDVYREVCVLLFFRYGITPTANKLYQLVRKGSMSAPAEALGKFWETLRDKSRIRIEHPDLPQALREAAGQMVGAFWQQARINAQDTLEQLREEAQTQVQVANAAMNAASLKAQQSQQLLDAAQQSLQIMEQQWSLSQTELARVQGEAATLLQQVNTGIAQQRQLQEEFNTSQQRLTQELEQQRAAATMAEERHAMAMKRWLLEADRERTNAAKLQKELEQVRRTLVDQAELQRQQQLEKQQALEALTQQNGTLTGRVAELQGQREQLNQELTTIRLRLENWHTAQPARRGLLKPTARNNVKTVRLKHPLP